MSADKPTSAPITDSRPAPRYDLGALSPKHVAHVIDVRRQETICGVGATDMQVLRRFGNVSEVKAERSPYGWPGPWCRHCVRWLERW